MKKCISGLSSGFGFIMGEKIVVVSLIILLLIVDGVRGLGIWYLLRVGMAVVVG